MVSLVPLFETAGLTLSGSVCEREKESEYCEITKFDEVA